MSPSTPEETAAQAGRTWNVLAERVDALSAAWEAGASPPRLASFLPAESGLRRLGLIELVKVDLEYRWIHHRHPRLLEDYLAEFPELADGDVPCDLLYEEFHVRRLAGDPVDPRAYFERFPRQADRLARLLGADVPRTSTSLFRGRHELVRVEAGQQLDDFDLLAELGQGTLARVFLARQRSLQRLVAVKISADRGDEPQTLAQLDHPCIVRVHDQRVLAERALKLLYMPYVPGGTLLEALAHAQDIPPGQRSGRTLADAIDAGLRRRGELPPADSMARARLVRRGWAETVCWLGLCLAEALDHAHQRGVLHRDVKPANVLLTAEGWPQLADFNVSYCSKLEGASAAAFFGGSLAYMSPEQLQACNPADPRTCESLDGRSDLYSLGVVLWELLNGSRPFPDEPLAADWPAAISRLVAQRRGGLEVLPQSGLDEVLLTCLAPEPEHRHPSAGELAWQLGLCLQPDTRRLLLPPPRDWRRAVRRWPLVSLLAAVLLPNLLATLFNFAYNRQEIISLLLPGAADVFWNVTAAINGVAFPAGIALMVALIWPVAQALRRLREGEPRAGENLARARRRCLRLGHWAALLSLGEWLVAGLAFPLALHLALGEVPVDVYLHFLGSLALCGLIAATYPFFAVTFLVVHALYPALLRPESRGLEHWKPLSQVARSTGLYLLLAASVPMVALGLLAMVGSRTPFALVALGSGLVGVGLAFALTRAIQADAAALAPAILHPHDLPRASLSSSHSSGWPLGG